MKMLYLKNKKFALILCMVLLLPGLKAKADALWVGQSKTCEVTIMGIFQTNVSWNVSGGYISLTGNIWATKTATVTQYFNGPATITCTYQYKLYSSDQLRPFTQTWQITCNDNPLTIYPTSMTLEIGQNGYVVPQLYYTNSYSQYANISFISHNHSVATVSSDGRVTAVGGGTTLIQVQSTASANSCLCTVTVKPLPTSVTLPESLSLEIGETMSLSPVVVPSGASATLTWNSSNTSVASVNSNGVLTGVGRGMAIVNCYAQNGIQSNDCVVTVGEPYYFTISTSANPTNGGTVTGGGTYQEGTACTVTATANDDYTLLNWTKNGVVVSTMATYTFVVTEDAVYTANFADNDSYYTITTTTDPTDAGTVSGGGNYFSGQNCTLVASPANGYSFLSWTENGSVVSTNPSYSFTVTSDKTLVAHFFELPVAPTGAIQGVFSVSDNQQVWFSKGNLQYVGSSQTWRFATNQWTIVGTSQGSSSQSTTRDLFGWGTSGWNCGNTYYRPWDVASSDHEANSTTASLYGPPGIYNLTGTYAHSDWGVHNSISNTTGQWRTLTREEWNYVLNTRNTSSGIRYALARVNNVRGVILLPDDWSESTYHLNNTNPTGSSNSFNNNVISSSQWTILQDAGAIFLPLTLERSGTEVLGGTDIANGFYWTSTTQSDQRWAYVMGFSEMSGNVYALPSTGGIKRDTGCSVRLVSPVPSYIFDINAVPNPVEGGTVGGTGSYHAGIPCTLTATANEGYNFVNWTRDGQVVSTNPTYTFTVTEEASFVANFIDASSIIQTLDFVEGWNWFSCNIDFNSLDGLNLLEQELGNNGTVIKSQYDFVVNYDGLWLGSLNSMDNMSTYMVNVNSDCSVNLVGPATNPSAAPITLNNGWTWIGYPVTTSMSIVDALANLSPLEGDVLKSLEHFSVYYSGWIGSLNTLTPGLGLMYQSNNSQSVSFTFPNGGRDWAPLANPIIKDSPWVPDMHAYPNNMTVMAVVDLNGGELQADHYELGVFDGNGICRGCVRMMLVEPIDRYVAFLTIAGEENDDLRFGLRDTHTDETCLFAYETLPFGANAIIGNLDMPLVLHFRGMNNVDDRENDVYAYPNPVEHGQCFSIGYTASIQVPMRVEIINAFGAIVAVQTFDKMPSAFVAPNVSGIYMIRITVDGKECLIRKLVVK